MQTNQTEEVVTHVLAGEIRFEKISEEKIEITPSWKIDNIPQETPPHGSEVEK